MMCTKFASRLILLRESKGMSREEFGDIADVSPATVKNYEGYRGYPSGIEIVEKLARVHGVSPAWLVGWSDQGGPDDGLCQSAEALTTATKNGGGMDDEDA